MSASKIELDAEDAATIRRALVLGLSCLGIIEESIEACVSCEAAGQKLPKQVRPPHPLGSPEGPGIFADALQLVT